MCATLPLRPIMAGLDLTAVDRTNLKTLSSCVSLGLFILSLAVACLPYIHHE
ncbi:hypothetical protein BKA66DRAFT_537810 [Pyrenochaeta sp. MPI-SDFR-AT-0127]|nr:hypothetical protein BKA66DRAFT_537810 [Pyrenochaeta sp. MPI-SDFR-AT-0127]